WRRRLRIYSKICVKTKQPLRASANGCLLARCLVLMRRTTRTTATTKRIHCLWKRTATTSFAKLRSFRNSHRSTQRAGNTSGTSWRLGRIGSEHVCGSSNDKFVAVSRLKSLQRLRPVKNQLWL
ncbi:hypothetical protein JG688_00015065, partial [Phytophthora aleatoria]